MSASDIKVACELNKACEILKIKYHDNLIVTESDYFSFNDEGIL